VREIDGPAALSDENREDVTAGRAEIAHDAADKRHDFTVG
jgi:hypothetical protein